MAGEARRGPGRPPSDAPERILAATLDVLNREGYAGLTTARVASESGQNKAMIAYYFGSKQGLIATVARRIGEGFIDEILSGLGEPSSVAELVEGLLAGIDRARDLDPRLPRVYFDLSSQAAVESEALDIIRGIKRRYRQELEEQLRLLPDGPAEEDVAAAAVYLIASIEGLALEQLERGEASELARARRMFVRGAAASLGAPRVG